MDSELSNFMLIVPLLAFSLDLLFTENNFIHIVALRS